MNETPSGLKYEDTVVGTGASPPRARTCVMHYTGWLWVNGAKGAKFDSSLDRGEPFEFPLGHGARDQGLGRGRGVDEGRRQAHAADPARARLRRSRRRRRDPAARDAAVRGRAARASPDTRASSASVGRRDPHIDSCRARQRGTRRRTGAAVVRTLCLTRPRWRAGRVDRPVRSAAPERDRVSDELLALALGRRGAGTTGPRPAGAVGVGLGRRRRCARATRARGEQHQAVDPHHRVTHASRSDVSVSPWRCGSPP